MKKFEDEAYKAYLEHARTDMVPKMRDSAMSVVVVNGEVDIKLCVELGAAVLLDKPIVVLLSPGATAPANLKRLATRIVEGDATDPAIRQRLEDAIADVFKHDARAKAK